MSSRGPEECGLLFCYYAEGEHYASCLSVRRD